MLCDLHTLNSSAAAVSKPPCPTPAKPMNTQTLRIARRPFLAAGLILAALGIQCSTAATFHVAPTGVDTNPGTATKPFRQIRKALAVLAPGDTVYVENGSYLGFNAVSLGSATTTTSIIALGTGAVVTKTTDRGTRNDADNIVVYQCTNLVIDGMHSTGASDSGMRVAECAGLTVRNCVFGKNAVWGIVTSFCDDLLLENNECYGSVQQHGIYVANSGDRPVVRGNLLHDNAGSGLRSSGDATQGGDGIISGAVFEDNIIYNNGALGGAAINSDGLQDSIIRNNLIYNNRGSGIALFQGLSAAGPTGVQVLDNTIVMPSTGRYDLRITDVAGPLLVRNNILYNSNMAKGSFSWNTTSDAAFTDSDCNVFGGTSLVSTNGETTRIPLATWIAAGHEPHSIPSATLKSLFVNAARNNYQLVATSPAVDRGTPLANVPTDLLGVTRPQGAAFDIGAYEFVPAAKSK